MLEKLKKRSIKKRIERYVALRDTSGRNTSLQTLGVLVDEGLIPDLYLFEDLPASLGVHPNKFRLFSFLEVKKKLPSIRQNQINNKDFSFKGQVKNNNALEFVEFPFDVLIGYYRGKNVFLDQLMAMSKARFKVGFKGGDPRLFDLILEQPPEDFKLFKRELKKYLQILNKIKE
jgi:hypothetical protein